MDFIRHNYPRNTLQHHATDCCALNFRNLGPRNTGGLQQIVDDGRWRIYREYNIIDEGREVVCSGKSDYIQFNVNIYTGAL